jgi:hypothetical protein
MRASCSLQVGHGKLHATWEFSSLGDDDALLGVCSGEVENGTVVLLSSDGERRLSRAARGPREIFGDAANMAAAMDRTARENPGRESPADEAELPGIAGVRLAAAVAACDNRPLALIDARGTTDRRALEQRLAPLAASDEFRGRFIRAVTKHQSSQKIFREHVRAGHQQGVFWETALPVTDPMEHNARERGRRP